MLDSFQSYLYSVSDLNAYVRALLESNENLMDIWVSGEISNLSRPQSGHIYFTMKDNKASVKCVIWRMHANRISGVLRDGLLIEAHGHVSVYEGTGQYQLYVDGVQAAGEGQLYQEFLFLKDKFTKEGLFDEERKKEIPMHPSVIGIVTSPTGAALQDMLNTLRTRYPLCNIVVSPTSVQGKAAPPQIIKAIEKLNYHISPDVILIGRGGGSLEGLWAFNDEDVVRAVAASSTPIISGVGHETDFTLTDFAADLRAATPTGAAVLAVPDVREINVELLGLKHLLNGKLKDLIERKEIHLLDRNNLLFRHSPSWKIKQNMQFIDTLNLRLDHLKKQFILNKRQKIMLAEEKITAYDPKEVLGRGYALVESIGVGVITSVKQVKLDQGISVTISDGIISADVTDIKKKE